MKKILVFATHNAHKAREAAQILGDAFEIRTLTDIGCHEEIEESGSTLQENALIKARHVRDRYGYDCFSEDTGLEVDALDGAPGVHTARFAGEAKDPGANMALLLERLQGQGQRSARFRTVIALTYGGEERLIEGVCEGQIAEAPRGEGGFGYDPVFIPQGYEATFAQLGEGIKNQISHRALAVAQLREALAKP